MPESPASAPMPRTLSEAKTVIKTLRAQLSGHGPPAGGRPIPKTPEDPHPLPDRNIPINPDHSKFSLDLGNMAPATFARFLSERTGAELKLLLSQECSKSRKLKDDRLVSKLYAEIKKRRL